MTTLTSNYTNNSTKMQVIISAEVHAKIMTWVEGCDIECSGLGKVKKLDGNRFLVTDAVLLDQECTGATTTLDANAIGKVMYETKDSEGDLNWWWHSHVNMPTFWSGTDLNTIHELADKGYCLATVFNKSGNMLSAYEHRNHELLPDIMVDMIPTTIEYLPYENDVQSWMDELNKKVREESPVYAGYAGHTHGYYKGYADEEDYVEWEYKEYHKGQLRWVWNLPHDHRNYATKKEVIDDLGYDPTVIKPTSGLTPVKGRKW